jgi:hypothetical protein
MERCGYRSVIACSAQGYFCSIDINLTMRSRSRGRNVDGKAHDLAGNGVDTLRRR